MGGCAQDDCGSLEYLIESGRCKACPKGKHVTGEGFDLAGKSCMA